ncbi:MAG: hypothetical protein HN413_13095 [Chloroflexi bacterium]|mgnify:CR=1 FL=1|jgi:hypothetical protein|nr:hypothetical protein [Chloroflexota bacterium]
MKNKLVMGILALVFATLACGIPTTTATPDGPNLEATQLAATIVALQQNQNAPTTAPTSEQAPANTQAPEATTAPTVPGKPMLSVSVNTNCRSGPGLKYPITGSIVTNGSFEVVARPASSDPYVIIKNPGGGADCWAWLEHATITGDTSALPTISAPPIPLGSISGLVWIEDCDDLNPATTGCITMSSGLPEGDGVFNSEFLLSGIVVELFSGKCPPTTSKATQSTNSSGGYKFDGLEAGTYCVVVDTFNHGNDTVLIQNFGGTFTFPNRNNTVQTHQVDLSPGKNVNGFNFGWDDFEQ